MSVTSTVNHYENFPVASLLLPRHAVPAVQALYRFARAADDIADEGDAPHSERLQALQDLSKQLLDPNRANNPLIANLAPFIAQGKLPLRDLQDLLSAFMQDVKQDAVQDTQQGSQHDDIRHADMKSLLDYCERSANPVGRLMLHCVGAPCNTSSFAASDAICSSLQLINFWQDLGKDALAGRIYIPRDVFVRYDSPITSQAAGYVPMMRFLCDDARDRMAAGIPLLGMLRGRFKAEIALTMAGGLRILDKIETANYDVIAHRPTLTWRDTVACLGLAWQLVRGRLK